MSAKQIKRAAVIDIGTKSLRLIIGERSDRKIEILELLKTVLPIGKDTFYKDRISQETINQALTILLKYKKVIQEYDVSLTKVFATTAVREARNKDIFLDAVSRTTGFTAEVFNVGDHIYYIESYLHYQLKGKYPLHEKNVLIIELGAGTVDVAILEKGYMLNSVGLPLGSLRLKNIIGNFEGDTREIRDAMREYIENECRYLRQLIAPVKIDDIILIAEDFSASIQKLLGEKRDSESFAPLSLKQATEIFNKCEGKTPEEIAHLYGVPQDIAETLEVMAMTVSYLFTLNESQSLFVFQTSLYEAVLTNLLSSKDLSRTYKEFKHLMYVARYLCLKYNGDLGHAKAVAMIARNIFMGLYKNLGLRKGDVVYLVLAAYLHDIGMFVSNRAHHKHSDYLIRSLNFFRLNEEDINIVATVARYHRKSQRFDTDPGFLSLSADSKLLVMKLSAILRIANALDRSHKHKVKRAIVSIDKNNAVKLELRVEGNFVMERWAFMEKKDLLEELLGSSITLNVNAQIFGKENRR